MLDVGAPSVMCSLQDQGIATPVVMSFWQALKHVALVTLFAGNTAWCPLQALFAVIVWVIASGQNPCTYATHNMT